MTVTHIPPLPVRDTSAGRALSPMLTRLAEERATGVLVREHGTLYLAEGRVVHAESPCSPGLDVLLTAHGTLATAAWQQAAAHCTGPSQAAELLLDSGKLPSGALELCHLDALYDAGFFTLAPSSAPGRFRYDNGPRLGPLPSVPVVALERETLRRRLLLHRLWPDPATDSAPLIRADPVTAAPVTPRQRAVLDRVDGIRSATGIARDLGRQAFHTLVDVRRLAAAGHLVAAHPTVPAPAPAHPPPVTDPDIALLKRLRDALEAL
ncbi:transcriptional regulator [Streptomyces broussonetiae]|uniref:Transcriptional regulator n=1 Tax=Streptomyces broussonetiae TaxID=2686304 RepID=A0A6I6N4Z4_9ACTN|nr:transcriptional regulator [Streptomyces broussonetiae]QHA05110.1 transcriptional regulator [Streptomyces broussonetiae]